MGWARQCHWWNSLFLLRTTAILQTHAYQSGSCDLGPDHKMAMEGCVGAPVEWLMLRYFGLILAGPEFGSLGAYFVGIVSEMVRYKRGGPVLVKNPR